MKPDSVFFVTGGAGGIGSATVRHVMQHGHRAVVCDVDSNAAQRVCEKFGDRATPVQLDVREPADWERALNVAWDHFGGIDVLVNNAGLIYTGWADDHEPHEIQHMIDVNFLGLVNGCRATVPRMIAQGHGHVVNIGSLAAYTTLPGQSVYCATKHAVRAFNHGYALEHRNSPVTFTLICPAAVNTPMWQKQIDDDAAALSFADRVLEADEVARAIYRAGLKKPREIMIPAFKGGSLKFVGAFPAFMARVLTGVEKKGRKAMEELRRARANETTQAAAQEAD